MKKLNQKTGFTLAELLIVVAIIAILVAIGIPAFSTAMERSRETVDLSNIRGAYAEFIAGSLGGKADTGYYQIDIKQRDCKSWVIDADGFLTNVSNSIMPVADATNTTALTTGPMWVKFTFLSSDKKSIEKVPTLSFVACTPGSPPSGVITTAPASGSDDTQAVDYYAEQDLATSATKKNVGHWYLTKEQDLS